MKLERSMSARRDFRSYALLLVGLVFAWTGATVDPATNCDESGRECAPWLVPVAFVLGVLATLSGTALLLGNRQWGSRVELAQRRLVWWDTRVSPDPGSLLLDEVARIRVCPDSDSADSVFFFDRDGARLPVPQEEIFPTPCEAWARDLAARFPHIVVEVERG